MQRATQVEAAIAGRIEVPEAMVAGGPDPASSVGDDAVDAAGAQAQLGSPVGSGDPVQAVRCGEPESIALGVVGQIADVRRVDGIESRNLGSGRVVASSPAWLGKP